MSFVLKSLRPAGSRREEVNQKKKSEQNERKKKSSHPLLWGLNKIEKKPGAVDKAEPRMCTGSGVI